MRNLHQEHVKKAFCYQKLFWPFIVWINCSSDLKNFANSWPSASIFKSFPQSLEHLFLTVGQNNFGNKIPLSSIISRSQYSCPLTESFPFWKWCYDYWQTTIIRKQKKRKFFEKQFTAKVNTRRDKAITEKKGFTNLVRRDLKMCFVWLESVAVFCYCLLGGSIFFNVQRQCYRNCSSFFQELTLINVGFFVI